MHADLAQILILGALVVVAAFSALALLVRRDLAPTGAFGGALDGGGRWFLGAALGLGVIAFSIKLAIITTLANFPQQTISPLLEDAALRAQRTVTAAPLPPAMPEPAPVPKWHALPALAPAPADNPTNPAKIALGQRLFHDSALSADRTLSCASCHDTTTGMGDDGRPTALGISKIPGKRNTPTVFNAAFQARLFWDGRAASLEEQALGPMLNPDEMGMPSLAQVEARIKAEPSYAPAFAAAFGDRATIGIDTIAKALAAYERSLITPDTAYDRFVAGDAHALDSTQRRGMWLFESLGCVTCHSGPNFSGASMVGPRNPYATLRSSRLPAEQGHILAADKGRAGIDSPEGIWRIPSLRNVALTAPYFHNGSVATLSEAVRIMVTTQINAVITDVPAAAPETLWWTADSASFSRVARKRVSSRDLDDLVAFLHALSSDTLSRRKSPG